MIRNLSTRLLERGDCEIIWQAFTEQGWNKPTAQYEKYYLEQLREGRHVLVAAQEGLFAGYISVLWESHYPLFREAHIPEIVEFNVLKKFQRRGIGSALLTEAERLIQRDADTVGIGMGLMADYGAAQRMYIPRGYVPDGRGIFQTDHHPKYGESVTVDDDLVLYFTKRLGKRSGKMARPTIE